MDWNNLAGAFVAGLRNEPQTGPRVRNVLDQLAEWSGHLRTHALRKWGPKMVAPQACAVPHPRGKKTVPCEQTGVATCDVCGRLSCLAHCRIDYLGDAICAVCIGEAKRAARGRAAQGTGGWKDEEAAVALAYKTLGLRKTATWEQVRARHRKLVVELHPDKPSGSQEAFVKVQAAYELLKARMAPPS